MQEVIINILHDKVMQAYYFEQRALRLREFVELGRTYLASGKNITLEQCNRACAMLDHTPETPFECWRQALYNEE